MQNNLSVAHKTGEGAHDASPENGLRVMHRVTVGGKYSIAPVQARHFASWLEQPEGIDGKRDLRNCPFGGMGGMWEGDGNGFRLRRRPRAGEAGAGGDAPEAIH